MNEYTILKVLSIIYDNNRNIVFLRAPINKLVYT